MRKTLFALLLLPALLPGSLLGQPGKGYEMSSEGAWCWFADPRAIRHENPGKKINKTYVGYIDVHGNIKAMQYDFVKNEQVEVLIRSWFQPDDHNNPTFLVLPDDRVMVFYSRHTDERCFYYRISRKPGDLTTLGEEKRLETDHNTTYPSPFILADDPEHIYLCWRGLKWHPTVAQLSLPDSHDEVKFTKGPYQMVQSTGARPYAKYVSDGKSRIYVAYTTGHPDNESPNFLYFNYLDIRTMTLHDVQGTRLSSVEQGAFAVSKSKEYTEQFPLTVVDNPQQRNWVWQVAIDPQGAPVIGFVRISEDKKSHDYYYGKWTGTAWKKTFLGNGGGHFHQTDNLEMCYSGGMAIDPDNVNEVYGSVPVEGRHGRVYELIRYRLDAAGTVVSSEAVTRDSEKNNVRPYLIGGSAGSPLRLTWMYGDYYDWIVSSVRPGYPTAIHSDFKGMKERLKEVSSGPVFEGRPGKKFTISLDVAADTARYEGTLFEMGELSYRLNGETLKPEIIYKDKVWPGTNVLGTADSWKNYGRGTTGKWFAPVKSARFNVTFTYEKGVLSTFINGLLDQRVEIGKMNNSRVVSRSANGWVKEVRVYKPV